MFVYNVSCSFEHEPVADEWVKWLRDEHLRDVCEAGALDAEVVRMDLTEAGRRIVQVRYHFADRAAFEAYERNHAPRLREEGLKRFPPGSGLAYARSTGEVLAQFGK